MVIGTLEGLVKDGFQFNSHVIFEYITPEMSPKDIIKILKDSGVNLGQGYLFGEAEETPIQSISQRARELLVSIR